MVFFISSPPISLIVLLFLTKAYRIIQEKSYVVIVDLQKIKISTLKVSGKNLTL